MALIDFSDEFGNSSIDGLNVNDPTTVQIGPDDRLYVGQKNGIVKIAQIDKASDGWKVVGDVETVDLVNNIPNHDDDGDLSGRNNRQLTGLAVEENAQGEIELYVTSSDPRIGAGGGGNDSNLDTNSGIVSRITKGGDDTFENGEKVDLVIGLPRSEENHSTNGLAIRTETVNGEDHQIAYVAQGGHTNKGAPSNNFTYTPEYYYSGAILKVDITQLKAMETDLLDNGGLNGGTAYVDSYVHALPTLDDPTRTNINGVTGDGAQDSASGTTGAVDAEAADTFGGNDGLNQAKFEAGGPVQIYSPGYRNAYDVEITEAGNIYTFDNGPNNNWGGEPVAQGGSSEVQDTSDTATNRPNLDDGTNDSGPDNLHLVTDGFYGGHPNPTRAAGADASLYEDQSSAVERDPLPADLDTINGGNDNPVEGVYKSPNVGPDDGSLFTIDSSSNGLTEYTANGVTDDPNAEVLAVASFNGKITFMETDSDGTQGGTHVVDSDEYFVGGTPLDIWGVGNEGINADGDGAGAVFVARYSSNDIAVLDPETPPVATDDQDFDGILDKNDPLQFDPTNGTSTVLGANESLFWNLNPAGDFPGKGGPANGDYNIGFTGWMVNGVGEINPALNAASYITDLNNTIRGGASGLVQINAVTDGDAYTGDNDQDDALQTGFTPADDVADFTVRVPIFNPYSSVGLDENYGSVGFALGGGTQSSYLKVVAGVGGGDERLQVLYEENDTVEQEIKVTESDDSDFADLVQNSTGNALIDLSLKVDLSTSGAATAQAFYNYQTSPDGEFQLAQPKAIGGPITLQGEVLDAVLGRNQIADENGQLQDSSAVVSFIATSTGPETPFEANFADLEITSNGFPATAVTVADQTELDAASPTPGVDTVDFTGAGALSVPDGFENLTLANNTNDGASVTLNEADNAVAAGPGAHSVDLAGGVDSVTGSASDLNGDSFSGFDEGDSVTITGIDPNASVVSTTPVGSVEVAVDSTGDGAADTTFTLSDDDIAPEDVVSTVDGGALEITLDQGPGDFVIGINSGGPEITGVTEVISDADTAIGGAGMDLGGQTISFNADTGSADGFSVSGEDHTSSATNGDAQDGTDVDGLFQQERWGDYAYDIDVGNGVYTVDLYFTEQYNDASQEGGRIFDVNIEGGALEVDGLDIVAAVNDAKGTSGGDGADYAYGLRFEDIAVGDGSLTIDAIPTGVDNPKINGVAVFQQSGDALPDTTDPTVVSIEAEPTQQAPGNDGPINITVEFADETGLDIDSIMATSLVASAGDPDIALLALNSGAQDGDTSVTATFQATSPSSGSVGGWPINTPIAFTVDGVTDEAGNAIAAASDSVTFSDVQAGDVVYRVNAGDGDVAATDGGPTWLGDTALIGQNSTGVTLSGQTGDTFTNGLTNEESEIDLTNAANGVPWQVFVDERGDNSPSGTGDDTGTLDYAFDVEAGTSYQVTIHYTENWQNIFTSDEERVFDVSVEGAVPAAFEDIHPLRDATDVVDGSGAPLPSGNLSDAQKQPYLGVAFSRTYTFEATDDELNLSFLHNSPTPSQNPKVNAIEIVAADDGTAGSAAEVSAGDVTVNEGDGTADVVFTLSAPVSEGPVTVAFSASPDTATAGDYAAPTPAEVTFAAGETTATATFDIVDDAAAESVESFTVEVGQITAPSEATVTAAANSTATVTIEDNDTPAPQPGDVVFAVNVGGDEVTDTSGLVYEADVAANWTNSTQFTDGDGSDDPAPGGDFTGDGVANADDTIYVTERYGGSADSADTMTYTRESLAPGEYVLTLKFAEIFDPNAPANGGDGVGARVFDVTANGATVVDDLDLFDEVGLHQAYTVDAPVTVGQDGVLTIGAKASADNAKISGIVLREAGGEPEPEGGAAVLSINEGANGIETSNYGSGSFEITNTGTKDIASIEIDVTDALFPDAVFDPFGLAGDKTGKNLTINADGGTGVVTPAGGFDEDAIGQTYIGAGGTEGFETIRLEFDDFNPGETLSFAVDMDPNSIAGAEKGTLDSGAPLSGAGNWDIGGIGGAELIGSAFDVTYGDSTTSTGKLQGQGTGQQLGAKALSTQEANGQDVTLSVNGLAEGAEGTYGDGGPTVTIQGPAGETARVALAKGFIVPFTNEFDESDAYHDQLDAQLAELAASGFPANNAVEFIYADVALDGSVQDISSMFDFSQVADFDLSEAGLDEGQLPLGFAASVIDPSTDLSKGAVTSPIHLTYSDQGGGITLTPPATAPVESGDSGTTQVAITADVQTGAAGDFTYSATVDGTEVDTGSVTLAEGSNTFSVAVPNDDTDNGADSVAVTVEDETGTPVPGAQTNFTLAEDDERFAEGDTLLRINSYGPEIGSIDDGPAWSADGTPTNSPYLTAPDDRGDAGDYGAPVAGIDDTVPDEVFDTARSGDQPFSYDIPVAAIPSESGVYRVNLYFAETYYTNAGGRVFDTEIEGSVPANLDDLSVFGSFGSAGNVVSNDVEVTDGTLNLEFQQDVANNPIINGVEVVELIDTEAEPSADLSLTKTVSDATPAFGDTVTFDVEVANAGADAATGVEVTDLLPSGYAFDSATTNAGTYDETTGLWTVGSVADGATASLSLTATVQEAGSASADEVLYRINAGGSTPQTAADSTSPAFAPVDSVTGASVTLSGDNTGPYSTTEAIDTTGLSSGSPAPGAVFQTELYGAGQAWDFDVEAGEYTVNLYFAEIFQGVSNTADDDNGGDGQVGDRLFDVAIEDQQVLDDYDIFAEVGELSAVSKSFDVTSDGTLDIDFTAVADNAKISAIEIIGKGGSGGSLDYTNTAEVTAAGVADPDSTPGNGAAGEDDQASASVSPTQAGGNLVTLALATGGDAAEPDDDGQFTVSLEEAATADTVVDYTVAGTATQGADYTALPGQVTIAAGDTSATIDVPVLDDAELEDPETVTVTLTNAAGDANVALGGTVAATSTIADDEVAPISYGATVAVSGSTTFGTDAFEIDNTSQAGVEITGVEFDIVPSILSLGLDAGGTAEFPGAVWDPTGEAGDAGSQGLKFADNSAGLLDDDGNVLAPMTGGSGYTGDAGSYPFSGRLPGTDNAEPGGYRYMDLSFASFGAAVSPFVFGTDVDPQSIQNASGTGQAGAVSGGEIAGTEVTVTFEDTASGTTYTETRDLALTGLNSSAATFTGTAAAAAPTLQIVGETSDTERRVIDPGTDQQVEVSGLNDDDQVELYVIDASGYEKNGGNGSVTLPDDPFHANQFDTAPTLLTETADASGVASFDVTLSDVAGDAPATQEGLFFFAAGVVDGSGTLVSDLSAPAELKLAANADPVAGTPNAITGQEDATEITGQLAAATDAEDAPTDLTYALASGQQPVTGLTLGTDGSVAYTPAADFAGKVTFDYVVEDTDGGQSAATTATISVTPVNDAPSVTLAGDQSATAAAGAQTVTGFASGDPGGGADEAGQTVTYAVTAGDPSFFETGPAIDASGTLSYEIAAGASGTTSVAVTPSDDGGTANGGEDTGSPVSFGVTADTPSNSAPEITTGDAFDFVEGASGAVFTAAATDADGDAVSFSLGGADADAFVLEPGTGAVSFDQTPDFATAGDNTYAVTLTADDGQASAQKVIDVEVLEDSDGDLVANTNDNAINVANPNQRDTDVDGYGNVIDADFDNDGDVDIGDLGFFRDAFGATGLSENDPRVDADLSDTVPDGGANVGIDDLGVFRDLFGVPLGESGVADIA